ncbi:nucleoside deaminase [Pararobbsia silviterrae]|uniref:Nucleoside deaminase n=1 Tax=Pararobbsia silviterrae TaxID=1792498 RepID=A0A494Y2Y6_9BURK|nr:nucleoside deaminase [Pararobbsia silviterrae]RKP54847.1 nucleoside deaminase [Pararobbsia silviterrae]
MFEQRFLDQAVQLAVDNVREHGGRPFGAVIVRDGQIVSTGVNTLLASGDPTAHAELLAIRAAAQATGALRLTGCTVYASGQPCPMCMGALHLAGVDAVFFAYSKEHGAQYGVASLALYDEVCKPIERQSLPIVERAASSGLASPYDLWRELQASAPQSSV